MRNAWFTEKHLKNYTVEFQKPVGTIYSTNM